MQLFYKFFNVFFSLKTVFFVLIALKFWYLGFYLDCENKVFFKIDDKLLKFHKTWEIKLIIFSFATTFLNFHTLLYIVDFMKKTILIVIATFFSVTVFAQADSLSAFAIVLENSKADSAMVQKLKAFEKQGIERQLDVDSIAIDTLLASASKYLGTPHCMGGTSMDCIDCSGLLFATFNDLGIKTPHGSEAMAHYGKIIPHKDSLIRGDLVFFVKTYRTSKVITHSGFYLGDGKFIHTSSSKGVVESNLNYSSYWKDKFIFGTRIFYNQESETENE